MTRTPSPDSRLIFLDIDGTYASHGYVPAVHVEAVRAVRANGHRVLLCTGRPRSTVSARILEAGFDGLVAGAGAYAEYEGTVLRDEVFPADVAARAIDALMEHQAVCLVESTSAMYALPEAAAAMDRRAPRAGAAVTQAAVWEDLIAAREVVEDLHGLEFAKVVTLSAQADLVDIATQIGPEVAAVETSIQDLGRGAGELYLAHVTKALGIQAVLDHVGAHASEIIAAGDGPNDIEMLELAGTAVGIHGGHPRALAAADLVVPGPEEGGLAIAFAQLGLTAPGAE